MPKQITVGEIRELITAYGEAAARCGEAGLDAIELQTSTDYLLGSFLSPVLNRRTDVYGGSFENRIRFVVQILESIREKVGTSLAVGVRTSARHDIPGSPLDYGLEESVASMKALADAGLVDYVSVMTGSGWASAESSSIPHMAQPRIQLEEEGRAFKQVLPVPIVIAGRIRSPEDAEPGHTALWRLRPYLFDGIRGTEGCPSGRAVLAGDTTVSGNILIINEEGGGPAVSLAETLVAQPDVSAVTVTTPERSLGEAALTLTWEIKSVSARIRAAGIGVLSETQVQEVQGNKAVLTNGETIGPYDAIVLSTGTIANETPEGALAIGDCVAPRGIWAATSDAARLARTI